MENKTSSTSNKNELLEELTKDVAIQKKNKRENEEKCTAQITKRYKKRS